MDENTVRIDARPNGFGVVCNGKSELWNEDIDQVLLRAGEELEAGTLDGDRSDRRIAMPPGWRARAVVLQRRRIEGKIGYSIFLCYQSDGTESFGGISAIWPSSLKETLAEARKYLELLRDHDDVIPPYSFIPGPSGSKW